MVVAMVLIRLVLFIHPFEMPTCKPEREPPDSQPHRWPFWRKGDENSGGLDHLGAQDVKLSNTPKEAGRI